MTDANKNQDINTKLMSNTVLKDYNWDEALKNEAWIAPFVNLHETNDEFILSVNMPGVSKDNIKIKVENDTIIIMGRKPYKEFLKYEYVLQEFEFGNYYRRFKIADSVDVTKIEADYKDGILNINLPKYERIKQRNIIIK